MTTLTESRSSEIQQLIIGYLIDEGYGTYARRLGSFKFVIADMYKQNYVEVAALFFNYGTIVVNPAMVDVTKMFVIGDNRPDEEKLMQQLSVLLRHELLHSLLVHDQRFIDHLKEIDPAWEKTYHTAAAHTIANYAMDYDISLEGYDDHDKEVVRLMTLNRRVVGGLIAEDDHPEWGKKSMEEMYDILAAEHKKNVENMKNNKKQVVEINVNETSHSQEYVDVYNKVIELIDSSSYSDADIAAMIADALDGGKDIIDPKTGASLLA